MKSSNLIKQLRHFDQKHDYWLYSARTCPNLSGRTAPAVQELS